MSGEFDPNAAAALLLRSLLRAHPVKRAVNLEWRRFRTTAGTANFTTNTISLGVFLQSEPEKLEKTLKHEYAHLLAYSRHGRRGLGHGPAWRQAMIDLGEAPEVHHKYDCQRNQSRQEVRYVCTKCGSQITRKRRLPKRRKYVHAGCGGAIQFASVQRTE